LGRAANIFKGPIVSEIKKTNVGYTKELSRCGNCRAFSSQMALPAWMERLNADSASVVNSGRRIYQLETYGVEKKLRCSIHGFAIQRTAVCNFWNPATTPKEQS
jgi:predicted anti-sigma-YlaC factor YlaD